MKKAILVVSFGTTYKETLKLTIEKIEDKIRDTFKEYEIRRAFTAHMIIKKLKNRDGIIIDTPKEALEKLKAEGFEEIIVQPLHLIPGEEYDYVRYVVQSFENEGCFKRISLGRPALYFQGIEEHIPDDYSIFVDSILELIPDDKKVVFMGHGSTHYSNACYGALQSMLRDIGKNNVYIGTVEGYPTVETVIAALKKDEVKEVNLMPLMLVAGDHAQNDMASEEEDSWKTLLENEGIKVNIHMHGLGELPKFQDIYVQHTKDAMEETYKGIGQTKKA